MNNPECSVLDEKFLNKGLFLFRKDIFKLFLKPILLKNLQGYLCRVAIGKLRKKRNVYSIGIIYGFQLSEKRKHFNQNFLEERILIKFGKAINFFSLSFISNSFPTLDEFSDFLNKNIFFPRYSSFFGLNKKKFFFTESGNYSSLKNVKIKNKDIHPKENTFNISGSRWGFFI